VRESALISSFDSPADVRALAFDGSRTASIVGNRIEVHARRGSLPLARGAASEISIDSHWLVYRTGRSIHAVDTRIWRSSVLTVARGDVLGLSIEGRRVAWAERRRGPDVIRAAVLPR
jgi:hypothetical protein